MRDNGHRHAEANGRTRTRVRDAGIERPLRCRIGVHTDYCTVGNFGSEDRMDYTIIGGAVNLGIPSRTRSRGGHDLDLLRNLRPRERRDPLRGTGPHPGPRPAYPVATYRVVDLNTVSSMPPSPSRLNSPHLSLRAEPGLMSVEERDQAATTLSALLKRLQSLSALSSEREGAAD